MCVSIYVETLGKIMNVYECV